jgi:hypothetical protein
MAVLPPTRQLAKDDSPAASSETQATVPVSSRKEVTQAPILSARPRTTNDTAGVLLDAEDGVFRSNRLQAKDDSPATSSETLATVPVSIGSDEATTAILSDFPRAMNDTAGVLLGVEDEVFRSNRLRVKDDSPAASSETQATVPVSSRKEVVQAPILSARSRTKNDTAGVLLGVED